MTSPSFIEFWNEKKQQVGEALPQGIDALALFMAPGAESLGLNQRVEGEARMAFHHIPDPRDIDAVLNAYVGAKKRLPALTALLVHQWTDGEGMWDVFAIGPQRSMMHGSRIWGSSEVEEKGSAHQEEADGQKI